MLEVELPVCPVCQSISKIPVEGAVAHGIRNKCVGPRGQKHRPTTMEKRLFREVIGHGDRS